MAGELLLRQRHHRGEARIGQALAVLPHRLLDELPDIPPGGAAGQVPAGGLGELHQVLRQLLELPGLAVQHQKVGVLLGGGVVFLQKVHVIDDGGQGRLDIVGDVGDELRLQALALKLVLHGDAHPPADGVQVLPVAAEIPKHPVGVHFIAEVSGGQGLTALAELLQLESRGPCGGNEKQGEQQEKSARAVAQQNDAEKGQRRAPQHRPPDQGDGPDGGDRPPPDHPQAPVKNAEKLIDQGVAPPLPQLAPDANGHPRPLQQHFAGHQQQGQHQQGRRLAEEDVRSAVQQLHQQHQKDNDRCHRHGEIEVQGQLLLPAGDDLLPARAAAGGPGQIEEDHQQSEKAEGREIRRGAIGLLLPLKEALRPVKAVGSLAVSVQVEPQAVSPAPELPYKDVVLTVAVIEGGFPRLSAGSHGIDRKTQAAVQRGEIGGHFLRLFLTADVRKHPHQFLCLAVNGTLADAALRKGRRGLAIPAVRIGKDRDGSVPGPQRQQKHSQQEGRRLQPEAIPCFRLHFSPSSILYPRPQTTFRYRGSEGLISSFCRRWRICTATLVSAPKESSFHTAS